MNALELRQIAKRFAQQWVLKDASFDLEVGGCLVLYGANGSGKTTLLRVLAGATSPSKGEGRVFGFDLRDSLAVRQHIHLMGHQHALYADLTVRENLEFALDMVPNSGAFKWFPQAQKSGIQAALERVSMHETQHKRIRQLSAGMRKRTMLARMLLIPSPVVLIDEPFANLDLEGKKLVQDLLLEQRELGRTLIISSHEPELTHNLGTCSGTLEGGVLQVI